MTPPLAQAGARVAPQPRRGREYHPVALRIGERAIDVEDTDQNTVAILGGVWAGCPGGPDGNFVLVSVLRAADAGDSRTRGSH